MTLLSESPPEAGDDAGQLVRRTTAFVTDVVLPVEREVVVGGRVVDDALRAELQDQARQAGVFGPVSGPGHGGHELSARALAPVLEAAGASLLGPLAVNCAAPDDGNIHLLRAVADADQAARYLAPLARGEIRSSIAMTEPAPGTGSDPSMLVTSAERVPGGWSISGRKHLTTGADGAGFVICIAATPDGPTMFLVDADNPGMRVERRMPTLDRCVVGGHCEVSFTDCVVPGSAVLGAVGQGLQYAAARLAPSRLTFCMSWLGLAARAHRMAAEHISGRTSFGSRIADLGLAQALVADSEIDVVAARGVIATAADAIDRFGPTGHQARHATAIAKTFVAEAVWRVLDRSVQLFGGLGVCDDSLVGRFLVEARAFRIYEGPSEVLRWSIARHVLHPYRISTKEAG